MTFSTWSQTAASNTAVGGISTDGTVTLVNQIDNMFRGMMAELAVARDDGTIAAIAPRGYLHGLTLSNNVSDATNDIDIAVGECAASDSPYWKMALSSALTKRLDAGWAVGTNQGGLDTGVISNGTYQVWLIQRSDTGVVDALFSASPTSPTMPTNYDRKRRIGAILRESAAIVGFRQVGNTFRRVAKIDRSSTGALADTLLTISVPSSIVVEPIMTNNLSLGATSNVSNQIGNGDAGAIQFTFQQTTGIDATTITSGTFTNMSAQIRYAVIISSGTINANILQTLGWIDPRGTQS